MLMSEQFKTHMVALLVHEAHCMVSTFEIPIYTLQMFYRDNKFGRSLAVIGELRSIIPNASHVMALTATATKPTFKVVSER